MKAELLGATKGKPSCESTIMLNLGVKSGRVDGLGWLVGVRWVVRSDNMHLISYCWLGVGGCVSGGWWVFGLCVHKTCL